jgi:cytoplasmic tRNA 2-thiolation protein 2
MAAASCGPHCPSSAAAREDAAEDRLVRLSVSGAASTTCGKCDGGGAAVAVRGGVGMCGGCFQAHLFGKFKLAVTSNAMVRPTDTVLLAFSGGPASRFASPQFSSHGFYLVFFYPSKFQRQRILCSSDCAHMHI